MASDAGDDGAEGATVDAAPPGGPANILSPENAGETPDEAPAEGDDAGDATPPDPRLAELEAAAQALASRAEAAEADRAALLAQWADEKAEVAILAALGGLEFLGDSPDVRDRAARIFINEVKPDVEAFRDDAGAWRVRVKGGADLAEHVSAAAEQLNFLFAAGDDGGGSGSKGGKVPRDATAVPPPPLKRRGRPPRFMAGGR